MSSCCKHCGRRIQRRRQNPDKQYCGRQPCQNERRRRWRCAKLRNDSDYRTNQKDSHKRWVANHPVYYRQWRARHPDYVARNRALQKDRDRLRQDLTVMTRTGAVLANSDVIPGKSDVITVYYELLPVQPTVLAKRYASRRIFQLIPVGCRDYRVNPASCKEITRGTLPP